MLEQLGQCALLGELIGDPHPAVDRRPTVAQALRRCARGQVVPARRGGQDVAVCVLEDGRAFAVIDRCPHDGGRLSDGFVDQGRLVCSRHGWEFDPTGGCPGRPQVAVDTVPLRAPKGARLL